MFYSDVWPSKASRTAEVDTFFNLYILYNKLFSLILKHIQVGLHDNVKSYWIYFAVIPWNCRHPINEGVVFLACSMSVLFIDGSMICDHWGLMRRY